MSLSDSEREREISVRFSLGGSRASVMAQLLTECLVLAMAGGGLGLCVAAGAAKVFRTLAKSFPRVEEITLDWRIVLYTLGCAVIAALLCGLVPAVRATRRSIAGELARASRTQVSARNPLQWLLVAIQVALAVTLLVGAGLLLRSFEEVGRVSPGFDFSHILTLRVSGNWGETADYKKLMARINRELDELRRTPGVRSAAVTGMLPGIPGDVQTEINVGGRAETQGRVIADSRFVSDGYFATMKIPILAGEGCRAALDVHEALVNRSFANKYLNGVPAVGRQLDIVTSASAFNLGAQIVGIAADAREQGLNREPGPTVYWCLNAPYPTPYFLIRTQGEPLAMADTLRRKIHAIDPARSVYDVSPLEEHLSDNFAENRLRTILLTMFALTAVSLACIGLYGTLSYFVTVRRREVGLRLALGAARGKIVARFLLKGLGVALIGCAAGFCLAVGFARMLSGMLYGVSPEDGKTFLWVLLMVIGVAALASLLPAMRAANVEPMQVLREE